MKYAKAMKRLTELQAPSNPDGNELATIAMQLAWLNSRLKQGTLQKDGPGIWYALVQRLRVLADTSERDVIRHLRFGEKRTWEKVALALDSTELHGRQGAFEKWHRLISPQRRTTTGKMRTGGRRKSA